MLLTRSRMRANIKTEQNLASLIHKLPDELLVHIFVLGCPKPRFYTYLSYHDQMADNPLPYQVLVSSICRRWRRISLQPESSTLWSFIFIMLPFKTSRSTESYGPLIKTIVQRSGVARVTFTLKHRTPLCFDHAAMWGSPAIHSLLTKLLARSDHFNLHALTPVLVASQFPVFPITRDRYPRLQHLSMIIGWGAFPPSMIPRDRSFDLDTLECANNTQGEGLPLIVEANPRRLSWASRELNDATLATIGRASRLEELDIFRYYSTASQPYSSTTVKSLTMRQPLPRADRPNLLPPLGDLPLLAYLTM